MKKIITISLILVMSFLMQGCNIFSVENPNEDYKYTSFTAAEKKLYVEMIGDVIPFIPNNEYSVEEYTEPFEYTTLKGVNFIAYDKTQEDLNNYLLLFSDYYGGAYTDSDGKTRYMYMPIDESYIIEITCYDSDGKFAIYVSAYRELKGGFAGNGTGVPYDKLYTNEGVGLPSDFDGVYDVDFTKGELIKDVSNQGLYVDGCPSTGSPKVLVIPVEFSDISAESRGFSIDTIVEMLSKDGKNDYFSLYDYYYISSYGKLTLDITVLDFWFKPQYDSTYYSKFSFMHNGKEESDKGEQLILNEALDYLDDFMDLSEFDSDNNGTIDSVLLVNTLELDSSNYFYWAFRNFNIYKDEEDSFYEYDNVHAKDYIWVSYQFIYQGYEDNGNYVYDDTSVRNPYTFIHEFGHVIGLDDYYDYTRINFPLYGLDIMDGTRGDHNAYSKFNLGWITSSRLVVTSESITLKLEDFSKNGDTIIIANNFDESLGAYQEYYIIVYYTNNSLNKGDGNGYFDTDGILVYHINAAIYMVEGRENYDVYNKNTDAVHEQGTKDDLIEFVLSENYNLIYGVGESMSTVTDDYGNDLIYNFTVDELTSEYATITFTCNQSK